MVYYVQYSSDADASTADFILQNLQSKGHQAQLFRTGDINEFINQVLVPTLGDNFYIIGGQFANPIYNFFFERDLLPPVPENGVIKTQFGLANAISQILGPASILGPSITYFNDKAFVLAGWTEEQTLEAAKSMLGGIPAIQPPGTTGLFGGLNLGGLFGGIDGPMSLAVLGLMAIVLLRVMK